MFYLSWNLYANSGQETNARRRLPRERNSKSATSDCWMYYLQDTRIQVHYNWQVANWRRASKLSSFLKRNTLFDVSVEYLMEHSCALCFIVHARLYLYRILPIFFSLPPATPASLSSYTTKNNLAYFSDNVYARSHDSERHYMYTRFAANDVYFVENAFASNFICKIFSTKDIASNKKKREREMFYV